MKEALAINMMRRVAYGDCLRRTTRRYPKREAVIFGDTRLTFEQLNTKANRFGNALLKRNLPKGTKVGFISLNSAEHFIAFYGTAKAGMVFVPINPLFKPDELAYAVNHADCEVLVFDGQIYPFIKDTFDKFEQVKHVIAFNPPSEKFQDFDSFLEEGSPDEPEVIINEHDTLIILYTGGTTSYPRAAELTHLSFFVCTNSVLIDQNFTHHNSTVMVMPLFHVGAFIATTLYLFVGGCVIVMPTLDMKQIMEAIEKEKATHLLLLSPLWRMFLDHPDFGKYDLSSIQDATYFAAVMPEDLLLEVMEKFCPNLSLHFGQTEMSPSVTVFKPEDQLRKMKSLGNSTVHVEIGVMDGNGNLLPPGEIGEFVYRAPTVMKGYYKDKKATEEAFKYGWFHSGDLGYLDEDNFVYFVDRKKDMIKTGGENVASIEVEKAIYLDPRVQEVCILGLPHERWSEAITAFVIPKPGQTITEEEIISLCKENMVGFKVPKKVVFLDTSELPRSAVGKVLKYKLKESHGDLYKGEH